MDDELPRPSQAVIDDMLAQFGAIARQMARGDDLMREGREMRESADADFAKLRGYAELRGVDLLEELRRRQEQAVGEIVDAETAKPLPSYVRRFTVRDFILEQAQAAYPDPVRAADLRRQFQQVTGQTVHEKTFGMTLYRLSQESNPPIARQGHADWYFVPKDFRPRGRGLSALLGEPARAKDASEAG